jgi:scyllo-inositol 2-dehydrogenase (NAD+)
MVEHVNCAVIGLGRLGWRHAENLATRITGARLLAVVDVAPDRAASFARQYDVPFYTTDIDAVFAYPDIDAVVIVSPTSTHAPLIRQAVATQKAIFVEKPITLSLTDALAIKHLIHTSQCYCQVGFMRRFDPAYHAAAEKIQQGAIGVPIYFKAISRDPDSPPEAYLRESGRLFIDMSIHDYDIARFLMPGEIVDVTAMGAVVKHEIMHTYHDLDQALTFLHFASGAVGDIECSRNAGYGYDIRAEVVGTEGTLQIGSLSHRNVRLLNRHGASNEIVPNFLALFADAYELEMQDFITRVQRGDTSSVTAEDGYRALAVAYAATRSFDEQRTVTVVYDAD